MTIDEGSTTFLERIQKLSPQRLVLLAAELERRLAAREDPVPEPIAVIGIGCRIPGGSQNADQFWRTLSEGRDEIEVIPADRWDADAYYDPNPDTPAKTVSKWGGFIPNLDLFDAAFFGIAPREVLGMDPQHRMLLETSWEALEHAGESADSLDESETGVFLGISTGDYGAMISQSEYGAFNAYSGSGVAHSTAGGRLSHFFRLKGPNMSIDTACSSSGLALHLACQSLRNKECNRALAGGVNAILLPQVNIMLSQAHVLASDGRCKTFSRKADGFVRAEGCGILVLKRLSDARADGDRIVGLIRGSATNHDGRSSGLLAPNGPSQEAVVQAALKQARLAPNQIDYVEAHGTGTVLGDAIELGALANVFGKDREAGKKLGIGSVKTNVGHLEAAAGVTSVIKLLLALGHEQIPAHLHLAAGEENEALLDSLFEVPRSLMPWARGERPRIAGISSFGFSGSNVHLVIEEPPLQPRVGHAAPAVALLTASAKTATALSALCARYAEFLRKHPLTSLSDFAYTLQVGRSHFQHRVAFVAASVEEAAAQFDKLSTADLAQSSLYLFASGYQEPAIAFLLTGQGSQYAGMGRVFYEQNSIFRAAVDRCDRVLAGKLPHALSAVMLGSAEVPAELIHETAWTQPVLFAFEYALASMWQSWGVQPGMVIGHSLGEYVAACLAGVFSLEAALTLAYERGRLMGALPHDGTMLAVRAGEAAVQEAVGALPEAVSIAARNGPEAIVLSGRTAEVTALGKRLTEKGVKVLALTVSHAFHSPMMEPMLDDFERCAGELSFHAPTIPFISNVTGRVFTDEDRIDAGYWRRHVRGTVNFADGTNALLQLKPAALLEIGPTPVLLGMAKAAYAELDVPSLPALRRGRDGWQSAFEALQQMYLLGVPVQWAAVYREFARQKLALPTYPFQRQRYWISVYPVAPKAGGAGATLTTTEELPTTPRLYESAWTLLDASTLHAPSPSGSAGKRSVAIFGDATGNLQDALRGAGLAVVPGLPSTLPVRDADELAGLRERFAGALGVDAVVLVLPEFSAGLGLEGIAGATLDNAMRMLALLQELLQESDGKAQLPVVWLVTQGSCAVENPGALNLPSSGVSALAKVARMEHPNLVIRHVDLPAASEAAELAVLAGLVREGMREHSLAVRKVGLFAERLRRVDVATQATARPLEIGAGGAYLVTGAFAGLGLRTAKWLVDQGARELYLLGRREPSAEAQEQFRQLEDAGARIHARVVDVSQRVPMEQLFDELAEGAVKLRGIVHSAGVIDDGVLMQQTPERFRKVLAVKVDGGYLLHELSQKYALDFFVLFSSAAAVLGSGGQSNYAVANAFLDALAEERHRLGLTATSIAWGPWSEIGMATRVKVSERAAAAVGLGPITPEAGMGLMRQAVVSGLPTVSVLPIDWSLYLSPKRGFHEWPLFAELGGKKQSGAGPEERLSLLALLGGAPAEQRLEVIKEYVKDRILNILMLARDFPLHEDQSFAELGIDSLMSLELKNELQKGVEVELPSTLLLQYPTLQLTSGYLEALLASRYTEGSATAAADGDELIL